SARNELAARLRKEGRREEAAEAAGLAKPTVAAWAVNQLARRERDRVRDLLELAERQREAIGRGSTAAMREAAGDERRVLRERAAAARELLSEEGRPTPATLEKVSATLRSAASNQ